jgi:hypothetical protein
MLMFEWILALLLAAVLLKVLAERIAVPYPSLLAIAGGGLVLCAFCVVLGTLVLQGLTLRPLLRFLRFADDGVVESEISRARVAIMQAAVESLDGDTSPAAKMIREQYAAARQVAEDQHEPQAATKYDELRLRAIAAQRAALQRLRALGEIGDETFRRILEELDWSELDAAPARRFQPLAS